MALLYLVTESERDAVFYRKCAEHLAERTISWSSALRNRKGDGSDAVKKQMGYALQSAKAAAGGEEEVCFIAAIDNDRTPHPENEKSLPRDKLSDLERTRPSRLKWVETTATNMLGENRSAWGLLVALAVPVEMIESWTVKAIGGEQSGGPEPHFSRRNQDKSRKYYHPIEPPPQWKDLERGLRDQIEKWDDESFYGHVVSAIASDPEHLRGKSTSFVHFHDQLLGWSSC
ncbi:MAG: hypothetical protein NTV80_00050 [Verrucomicrobia bacterium]|nr:hypothetical protein [Verrucomicrobiota bacterium]